MFCGECGKKIEGGNFCPYCGSAVEGITLAGNSVETGKNADNENEIQSTQYLINNSQKPKGKKGLKVFLIVLIIALVFAGGGFSIYYFVLKDDSPSIEDNGRIELSEKDDKNGNIKNENASSGQEDSDKPEINISTENNVDVNSFNTTSENTMEDNTITDSTSDNGIVDEIASDKDTEEDSTPDNVSLDDNSENIGDDSENCENTSSDDSTTGNASDVSDDDFDDELQIEHIHSFWAETGDVCQICGEEFPADVIDCDVVLYAVDNGVAVRDIYYNSGKNLRYLVKGEEVRAVAMLYNAKSNLWFQLEDGGFVYSDNLSETYVEPDGEEWHAHEFESNTGDVCIICGQKFEASLYEFKGGLYSVKDNVPVRDFYYNTGEVIRYLEKGEYVYADLIVVNEKGSEWYSIGDGYVYGLNLSSEAPVE